MAQAPRRAPQKKPADSRQTLIETVQTPLGFFVLVVLVVEAIMGSLAGFSSADRLPIVWIMSGIIVLLIAVVTGLALLDPVRLNPSPTSAMIRTRDETPALVPRETAAFQIEIPEGLSKELIRCSFSGLIRIEVDGLHLLVRGARLTHQYQPVGGVYKHLPPSLMELQRLGVQDDNKIPVDGDSKDDLRVRLPGGNIQRFCEWFQSRRGREIDPWREFHEELVDTGIVDRTVFPYISCSFYRTHVTGVRWSEFMKCNELMVSEIFVMHPTPDQHSHLRATQNRKSESFRWVTRDEILGGGLVSGVATISPTAEWLF